MSDERAFLTAILERPDDEATKLVYADWLQEQGDPRGEYLQSLRRVRRERAVSPQQRRRRRALSRQLAALRTQIQQAWRAGEGASHENRERQRRLQALEGQLADLSRQLRQRIPARLQELAATFDPTWLAAVSDPEIEGCGHSSSGGWALRFDLVCEQTWANLKPTDSQNVRHCEACNKRVYFCDNLADAREHSREGHCIAVDLGGHPSRGRPGAPHGVSGSPEQ